MAELHARYKLALAALEQCAKSDFGETLNPSAARDVLQLVEVLRVEKLETQRANDNAAERDFWKRTAEAWGMSARLNRSNYLQRTELYELASNERDAVRAEADALRAQLEVAITELADKQEFIFKSVADHAALTDALRARVAELESALTDIEIESQNTKRPHIAWMAAKARDGLGKPPTINHAQADAAEPAPALSQRATHDMYGVDNADSAAFSAALPDVG